MSPAAVSRSAVSLKFSAALIGTVTSRRSWPSAAFYDLVLRVDMAVKIQGTVSILSFLVSSTLPEQTSSVDHLSTVQPAPSVEPRSDDAPVEADSEEPPEGYYAFVESPNATPPRVRPPPYRQVSSECREAAGARPHVSAHNLCGDLNRGIIPKNPMGQNPNGEPYPFELIRDRALMFLARTVPVLRADDTLPRVTHVAHAHTHDAHAHAHAPPHDYAPDVRNELEERGKRSLSEETDSGDGSDVPSHALAAEHRSVESPRESRKFCDGGGVFCMLYRAFNGDNEGVPAGVERREDPGTGAPPRGPGPAPHPRYEGPPTPCPARVEYATPVFARNYQGVWRYVVQIPYEGYFTQTVEVTRCMQSRCHYLEGGCLSSPRWVSLLVAELHYPPPSQQTQQYQDYQRGQATPESEPSTEKPPHCDGHDELGCYQLRMYYDWFLVPGSCKCWRPDYFAKYVRRRHNNEL
ncbi:spaetzle domain-containing protein 6 [Aphomia sociella]